MKFSRDDRKQSLDINITPLIDVVFLLLIFFMVSTSFIVSSSIDVDLPKAKGDPVEVKKNIRISINSEGGIHINGVLYPDDKVAGILDSLKNESAEATVVIEADKSATHGKVVFVMDAARKTGFEKFAIAVEEE
ncbi:biopolymer transporter ExbD [Geovibrio thiophilus]|uniref:Biopolymer transporter ExbD n=1 Tax=Geovibrio thiophilus TaxID=139438 RepID=A0A3R6AXQ5_9BACT|nr:biopolymer transporter ExbD [Geovibrio thiophilus]QAR32928.1 biopolymer transporter ExbD [Geovibrio thiophilus]